MVDENKITRSSKSDDTEKELKVEIKKLFPGLFAKKDEEEGSGSSGGGGSGGGSPNYRKLKDAVKERVSKSTQHAIEVDDEELDEIIKKLKIDDVGADKGLEMQRFRTISSRGRIRTK